MNTRPHSGRSGVPAAMDSDRSYKPLPQQHTVVVGRHKARSIVTDVWNVGNDRARRGLIPTYVNRR